jgi:hypothetical protein
MPSPAITATRYVFAISSSLSIFYRSPAKAGAHFSGTRTVDQWIPAFRREAMQGQGARREVASSLRFSQ